MSAKSDGELVRAVEDWMTARDRLEQAKKAVREAEAEKKRATHHLGGLVVPGDAKRTDVYCVHFLGRILELRLTPRGMGTHGMETNYEIEWRAPPAQEVEG